MDENLFDSLFLAFSLSSSALCDCSGGEQYKPAVGTR